MKRLIFASITLVSFMLLTACSSTAVPQVGDVVPCQIQSVEQVEQAVLAGLTAENWKILSSSFHIVKAQKVLRQMKVTVDVAYGYRGFSIEYDDSQNMDYDAENDTIGSDYVKWVYNLKNSIDKILKQEVKFLPPTKCLALKDQYQQE